MLSPESAALIAALEQMRKECAASLEELHATIEKSRHTIAELRRVRARAERLRKQRLWRFLQALAQQGED